MALGSESTNNNKRNNWREVVSAIKEAGKVFEKEVDPRSLRDFVRSLQHYKEEYATSKEIMREVLHQIAILKNNPYLQPHVFELSHNLSKPHGEILDSSHYDEVSKPETGHNYYSEGAANKAQRSFYYADNTNTIRDIKDRDNTEEGANYKNSSTNSLNSSTSSSFSSSSSSLNSSSSLLDSSPSTPKSPTQSRARVRNWSVEFWRALELRFNSPEESWNRSNTIKRIAHDFCNVATRHGRTIISEMFLPATITRTIPSFDAGGLAGGLKYVKDGIFFKFAVDNLGIYSGDHNAMKAAGHELKGLAAFMNCQIPGLRVPLMAIIDYRGFRLIATSSLPISSAVPDISPDSMFETQQQIQQQQTQQQQQQQIQQKLQQQIDKNMKKLHDQSPNSLLPDSSISSISNSSNSVSSSSSISSSPPTITPRSPAISSIPSPSPSPVSYSFTLRSPPTSSSATSSTSLSSVSSISTPPTPPTPSTPSTPSSPSPPPTPIRSISSLSVLSSPFVPSSHVSPSASRTPTEHPKVSESDINNNNNNNYNNYNNYNNNNNTNDTNDKGTSLLQTFNSLSLSPETNNNSNNEQNNVITETKENGSPKTDNGNGKDKETKDKKKNNTKTKETKEEGGEEREGEEDERKEEEEEREEKEEDIPTHTLVYGSCDGGNTVYNSDPIMRDLIKQAASILNLKLHTVGSKKKEEIYGPCDLEGHKIREGEYVVLDTARTFPPERPSVNSQQGSHLIRLLRPELVRSNRVPLSSDAFTSFGSSDPLQSAHNKEVEQAQQRLECEIIPNFVLASNQKVKKMNTSSSIFEVASQLSLIDSLHREGINVRYLPALKMTDVHGLELALTTIINTEIVARRAKNKLRAFMRANLREIAAKTKDGSELFEFSEKEILALVDFLNSTIIAAELQAQDMDGFSVGLLVERLAAMSGIHLSVDFKDKEREGKEHREREREENLLTRLEHGGILVTSDIVSVTPRVRYVHTVPYQEGVALYHQACSLTRDEGRKLLTVAEQKFRLALNAKPDDPAILTHWGILLFQKARLYDEVERQRQHLAMAVEKFREAVAVKRNHHYALFNWAEAVKEWSRISSGAESATLNNQATSLMREAGVFQKKWFFGTLPTNGAAGLLAHQPAHSFFIRNSNTRPGHFVFSHLTKDRKIKHTLILYNSQGKYTLARHAAQAYDTLEDFVMAKINEGYIVVTRKWWD